MKPAAIKIIRIALIVLALVQSLNLGTAVAQEQQGSQHDLVLKMWEYLPNGWFAVPLEQTKGKVTCYKWDGSYEPTAGLTSMKIQGRYLVVKPMGEPPIRYIRPFAIKLALIFNDFCLQAPDWEPPTKYLEKQ